MIDSSIVALLKRRPDLPIRCHRPSQNTLTPKARKGLPISTIHPHECILASIHTQLGVKFRQSLQISALLQMMMEGKRTKVVNPQLPPFHCLFVAGDSDGPSYSSREVFVRAPSGRTNSSAVHKPFAVLFSVERLLGCTPGSSEEPTLKVSGTTEPISTEKKMKFIDSVTSLTLLQFFLVNLACASRRSRL